MKYKFSNKTMFAIVMRDEAVCKEFIERLFPKCKVKDIRFSEPEPELTEDGQIFPSNLGKLLRANVETEKSIYNSIAAKSVRLDVIFEDSDSIYDIEMQVASERYMPQRTRYYHRRVRPVCRTNQHVMPSNLANNIVKKQLLKSATVGQTHRFAPTENRCAMNEKCQHLSL